ncbi:MAG: hypothetical protein ACFE0O_01945 [Opitutales bacterium]
MAGLVFFLGPAFSQNLEAPPGMSEAGSGEPYVTTIERKDIGTLKPEDERQVSILASRILTHLNKASEQLIGEKTEVAREELEYAGTLAGIIREVLPVSVVTTVVMDESGKEVYRYRDRVQNDRIPIIEGMIAVEVVEAEAALRLAERQVREEKYTGASINLRQARIELETYRTLIEAGNRDEVRELEEQIRSLEEDPGEPGTAETIRDAWHQVRSWFQRQPGQIVRTT